MLHGLAFSTSENVLLHTRARVQSLNLNLPETSTTASRFIYENTTCAKSPLGHFVANRLSFCAMARQLIVR